jgi:hypothetical protein
MFVLVIYQKIKMNFNLGYQAFSEFSLTNLCSAQNGSWLLQKAEERI